MSDYGTVTDYQTGAPLRPATLKEWRRSADKLNGRESDSYTRAWNLDGTAVYVDGGPEAEVTREDIRELRDEAGSAGDDEQVRYCTAALGEDEPNPLDPDIAWIECAQVILGTRQEFAASARMLTAD